MTQPHTFFNPVDGTEGEDDHAVIREGSTMTTQHRSTGKAAFARLGGPTANRGAERRGTSGTLTSRRNPIAYRAAVMPTLFLVHGRRPTTAA